MKSAEELAAEMVLNKYPGGLPAEEQGILEARLQELDKRWTQMQENVFDIMWTTQERRMNVAKMILRAYTKVDNLNQEGYLELARFILQDAEQKKKGKIEQSQIALQYVTEQRQKLEYESERRNDAMRVIKAERENRLCSLGFQEPQEEDPMYIGDPSVEESFFVVQLDKTLDVLSNVIKVDAARFEKIVELESKAPIVSLVEKKTWRRSFVRVLDSHDGPPNIVLASRSVMVDLGATEEQEQLRVTGHTCLAMFPVGFIEFRYNGTELALSFLRYKLAERIRARLTNGRIPALSVGQELWLANNIVVRVHKLSSLGNRDIEAGAFVYGEQNIAWDIRGYGETPTSLDILRQADKLRQNYNTQGI